MLPTEFVSIPKQPEVRTLGHNPLEKGGSFVQATIGWCRKLSLQQVSGGCGEAIIYTSHFTVHFPVIMKSLVHDGPVSLHTKVFNTTVALSSICVHL